jgi:dihydropyrimidine dehydrogenase (NAD+) subunit PreA
MADLSVDLAGIRSPNPFWLASAPPTNSGYQVMRAFDAGWGGAVWKTLALEPIVNVTSRFAGLNAGAYRMLGMNNIELITDRPLDVNLEEIAACKAAYPDRPIIASLMTECTRESWHELVRRVETVPIDGFELNFGCPHGMSERGQGAAVGQDPELITLITRWVKEAAHVPVIVKLTPNVADVRVPARAAAQGGADAISLINTINSLIGVDLETWLPIPHVDGKSSHGGFCGPAVKPIALNMVGACARDEGVGIPISGIGGIADWRDAVEFLLMGSTTVQVCTTVMHHGFRIVGDMIDGLSNYLDERGLGSARRCRASWTGTT